MNSFNIAMPKQTVFGTGKVSLLAEKILRLGEKKALILTGNRSIYASGYIEKIQKSLIESGIIFDVEKITGEPSVEFVDELIKKYRNNKPGVIVSIGGGSVIDAGKALSVGVYCNESISSYFWGNANKKLPSKKITHIAIPTTSGSGSEITPFAVLLKTGPDGYKATIRSHELLPDLSIVDPCLTLSAPANLSLNCGIDVFCHILESYTARDSNPFIDDLMPDAFNRVYHNLPLICQEGMNDIEVRSEMAYSAMMSGIGCANTSLTVLHGFTEILGGMYDIPHASLSAALMYPCTLINMQRVQAYDPHGTTIEKYAKLGSLISGIDLSGDKYFVLLRYLSETLDKLSRNLNLPKLSALGVRKEDFYKIVSKVDTKGNPVDLNEADLLEMLELAF